MIKVFLAILLLVFTLLINYEGMGQPKTKDSYWLLLYRKSNVEFLYFGEAGKASNSQLINIFKVKTGVPKQRPTPLPYLLGREYWLITKKMESKDNPETAPYFLSLDIPVSEEMFGPVPYLECMGQCNWTIPGEFGLHGINGDQSRLSDENLGSSGCIRHQDLDITYLYNLIDTNKETRYYIINI